MTFVCVPMTNGQFEAFVSDQKAAGPMPGCAVTAAFLDYFEVDDTELAEFLCLQVACMMGLRYTSNPIVVVAQTGCVPSGVHDITVEATAMQLRDVMSYFVMEPEGAEDAARVHAAVQGLELDDIIDRDDVSTLLATYDLLWYGPEEAGVVLGLTRVAQE